MILYSIIPAEIVFNGLDDAPGAEYIEASYKGEKVLVSRMRNSQFVITRLLSTKPSSYLDPAFQPGSIVMESELIY